MRPLRLGLRILIQLIPVLSAIVAAGQPLPSRASVALSIVDENGVAVSGAEVVVEQAGRTQLRLTTDYAGHAGFAAELKTPLSIQVRKNGFYESRVNEVDPARRDVSVVLRHEQMLVQQVNVVASAPGIDPQLISDQFTLDVPEIVNVPYPSSRDIRNLLPFTPGVIQDEAGQLHVAGSEAWGTLDLLDGFDIRSPLSGALAMRVSADAVRSISTETTRYPVEFGRSTGGVLAFYTGMGDNRFRFNATDFLPSFHQVNGIRFDKLVPRFTLTGPIVRDRAWFFDGLELEYDNIYIKELPENANTNQLMRGSNLFRVQVNPTTRNIVSGGVLFNDYHSPFDGLSSLVPRESTTSRNTVAWLPYVRDQHTFHNGALLDAGVGVAHFRDGYEPRGSSPFELTPERSSGSYFESLSSQSQRVEGNVGIYFPPRQWLGKHDVRAGLDADHIGFREDVSRAPILYLREDRTLLRRSTFPETAPFARHNVETGAYIDDGWTSRRGLLVQPGVRFDWDEVIRRPLWSPRIAMAYSPPGREGITKISAGMGVYYEHTQLEYLARALAGVRMDTSYAPDGVTPAGAPGESRFSAPYSPLREARAVNWSVGIEQKAPANIYFKFNYLDKHIAHEFTYATGSGAAASPTTYVLTSSRRDHAAMTEIEARRTFAHAYTLFGAYTHSYAHTNAGLDYTPTISLLGPQQPGPLAWDTPNRVLSWGWLPFLVPGFSKRWDFVYSYDWHTGFPFTAIDANHDVVGAPGSHRFPRYVSFSPGLEVRFHFRGSYFGLRGIMENATNSPNSTVVNNVVDSPQFGAFTEPFGRAITARIRLIQSK